MKYKGALIFPVLVVIVALSLPYLYEPFKLKNQSAKYENAEKNNTNLSSRKVMVQALEIAKKENFAPAAAARFYSYIATIYSDVLDQTNDPAQAEEASRLLMIELVRTQNPKYKIEFLTDMAIVLTAESQKVLDRFIDRSKTDNYQLVWDKKTPKNGWYIRNNGIDKAAMAGQWKTWILPQNTNLSIPNPPKDGSLWDFAEIEKVKYATTIRSSNDLENIYMWHGSHGFVKGQAGDNITPAGVWQNILFVEIGDSIDNKEYARIQRILAQSISDSFIQTWKVKYKFWTKRPSMKIKNLSILVQDPPFPSYVSGHSSISKTAAIVLSELLPSKKAIWHNNAEDAKTSRILAGIHFDIDNVYGSFFGEKVGESIISKLHNKSYIDHKIEEKHFGIQLFEYVVFSYLNFYEEIKTRVKSVFEEKKFALRECADKNAFPFVDATSSLPKSIIEKAGLKSTEASTVYASDGYLTSPRGISSADLNNDGKNDLIYLGLNNTFVLQNLGNLKFEDITLKTNISPPSGSTGVFPIDYNNDGLIDVVIYTPTKIILYQNIGDLLFADVTQQAGLNTLPDNQAIAGILTGDFDRNGFVDLYIINNTRTLGVNVSSDNTSGIPNLTLLNNEGRFTIKTTGAEDKHLGLAGSMLDYDNDGYDDIFIANDFGYNSLYKNNGNGTFVNVSDLLPRILNNGMGAAIGDYNHDGKIDLYVTGIYFDQDTDKKGNLLLKNEGDRFSLVADSDTRIGGWGWGTSTTDFDNDSNPDIIAVSGFENNTATGVSQVFRNPALFVFQNKDKMNFSGCQAPIGINHDGKGVIVSDLNNDGFEEIIINESGFGLRVLKNTTNNNHYITFSFDTKNSQIIGTKVRVKTGKKVQYKQLQVTGSYVSGRDSNLSFGTGKYKKIDEVTIQFPSGKKKIMKDVDTNTIINVTEN